MSSIRSSPGSAVTEQVSIVVPTYREVENIEALARAIVAAMEPTGCGFEIIIVDDDSRDGSEALVDRLRAEGLPVRIIVRRDQRDLSSAVIRGFREAAGELLVCMDADLSHPPEALPQLLACLQQGADFVIGSRYVAGASTDEQWGLLRWINSRAATLLARPFTPARDPMAGFFALRRETFESADALSPIGYKIGLELIVKCRCRDVREVPIHFADRRFGRTKMNLREQINYLTHLARLGEYQYGALSRWIRFVTIGAAGVIVDLLAFAVLLLAVPLAWARVAAIAAAMTFNFYLHRRLTYGYGDLRRIPGQYARFVASCLTGGVVNAWVSILLVRNISGFAAHPIAAAVVGIAAGAIANALVVPHWVFRMSGRESEVDAESARRAGDA